MEFTKRFAIAILILVGSVVSASAVPVSGPKAELEEGEVSISGYVQAQYSDHEDSKNAIIDDEGDLDNRNKDNIYVRRGRLKVEYQATKSSKFRIYFDGSKDKLTLLEVWVELRKKFGSVDTRLKAGQQNIPFGFEIGYSSSKRDFPERSTAERTLFAGERERLANLTITPVPALSVNVAVLNGPGLKNKSFTYQSPFQDTKDILGRVRTMHTVGKAKISGGVSVYSGTQFDASDTTDFKTDKKRYGADAQVEAKLFPELGKSALRAEVVAADEFGMRRMGWYVWLSQRLGEDFGAALRFDSFDPNTRVEDGSKLNQTSIAGHYYFDKNTRITASYDIRKHEEVGSIVDVADNILNLVAQFKF